MSTFKITAEHIDPATNEYIGPVEPLTDDRTNIKILYDGRIVRFKTPIKCAAIYAPDCNIYAPDINVVESVTVGYIECDGDVSARFGITVPAGIIAGGEITAGWDIECARGHIQAGGLILAADNLTAGGHISSKTRIQCSSVRAGRYIEAPVIAAKIRILAGASLDEVPTAANCEIRGWVSNGQIALGTHIAPAQNPELIYPWL